MGQSEVRNGAKAKTQEKNNRSHISNPKEKKEVIFRNKPVVRIKINQESEPVRITQGMRTSTVYKLKTKMNPEE